ncbi:MAG: hypothetical protein AN486_08980 [Anabaena sp. AL93]|jgi:hypothetical protein|nr:MAG: hypothetical protein AN486_08980 [Anabaena sp. AL93]
MKEKFQILNDKQGDIVVSFYNLVKIGKKENLESKLLSSFVLMNQKLKKSKNQNHPLTSNCSHPPLSLTRDQGFR